MNKIFDFEETGALVIDKIFFESYFPILFTCKNNKHDLFLCVCCQADQATKKWLLTKVSADTIIKLLSDEITIRDSFLTDNGEHYTIIYKNDNKKYSLEVNNRKDWDPEDSIDLPSKGEYLDADDDEYLDEVEYYKRSKRYELHYTKGYHESLTYKSDNLGSFVDKTIINKNINDLVNKSEVCFETEMSNLTDAVAA